MNHLKASSPLIDKLIRMEQKRKRGEELLPGVAGEEILFSDASSQDHLPKAWRGHLKPVPPAPASGIEADTLEEVKEISVETGAEKNLMNVHARIPPQGA